MGKEGGGETNGNAWGGWSPGQEMCTPSGGASTRKARGSIGYLSWGRKVAGVGKPRERRTRAEEGEPDVGRPNISDDSRREWSRGRGQGPDATKR